ncbi:MAG: hypothetical protein AAFS10_14215 [Myxococcota bacterium]
MTETINTEELMLIADILMGAAHADGEEEVAEVSAIEDILTDLLHGEPLPEAISGHLIAFDPASFDVQATCAKLHLATAEDRRTLLALVAEVTDADDVHAMAEDEYIRVVAQAIGASQEEYADLTVEVLQLSSIQTPPPLPPEALES